MHFECLITSCELVQNNNIINNHDGILDLVLGGRGDAWIEVNSDTPSVVKVDGYHPPLLVT